jgi:pilus assembly protein Flp/PilA
MILRRTKRRNRRGATAIEYGLLASLIAVVIIAALTTLGTDVSCTFYKTSYAMRFGNGELAADLITEFNANHFECPPAVATAGGGIGW